MRWEWLLDMLGRLVGTMLGLLILNTILWLFGTTWTFTLGNWW